MKNIILSIEDDPAISAGLKEFFEAEGYSIMTESDGKKGFESALSKKPELIILDVMLPSMSGYEICRDLRMKNVNTPVIMLTAKGEEADKILGLELGADDYMTKPFSVRELLARVKAILRRMESVKKDTDEYVFGDVKLEFSKMAASKGKNKIDLSLKEFEVLRFFIKHEGEVVTRNMLLDEVWGYDVYPSTRTVDNYILMIRKKIETNPSVPEHLLTIHSAGYRFVK
jgi:DNA-binding response OmpR family regulator